jgi:hypothetical protein
MIATILVGVVLAAHPTIVSSTDCPSSRDIASNLAVFLPEQGAQSGTVLITAAPDGLLVDLRPENPAFGAQRSVVVDNNCQERAKAVAVVIATWWPVGTAATTSTKAQVEATIPKENRRRIAGSAGAFASLVSGSTAPGVRMEASWSPRASALGIRLSFSGTGSQGGELGPGHAHFTRASIELGPTYACSALRVDAGLVASRLRIEGSDFSVNQISTGGSVGATAGLRLGWNWGPVLPWLELRGIWWPQSQRMYVADSAIARPIPHAELQFGAGMAFTLF